MRFMLSNALRSPQMSFSADDLSTRSGWAGATGSGSATADRVGPASRPPWRNLRPLFDTPTGLTEVPYNRSARYWVRSDVPAALERLPSDEVDLV
jgi:hypothetical protein